MSGSQLRRAVLIGGLDPSGGAGVLLDAFVAAGIGLQPSVAVTVLTAQNSALWLGAQAVAAEMVESQLDAVFSDGIVACAKIGAVGSADNVQALAALLRSPRRPAAVVLDPVIASTTGGELADPPAVAAMRTELFGLVDVVTPNAAEVMLLAPGHGSPEDAAASLAAEHGCAVLVTGLPHSQKTAVDLIVTSDISVPVPHEVLPGVRDPRGTGCMLSTALACRLTESTPVSAVAQAQRDVLSLLRSSRQVGRGAMQLDFTAAPGIAAPGDWSTQRP